MPVSVVLDTSVLYPPSLRDALLQLAARELYQPRWSPSILTELLEVLRRHDIAAPARLVATMSEAFPEARIDQHAVDALTATWTPTTATGEAMALDPDDRHVLAAAVVAGAATLVTQNVRHFPAEACAPFGVTVCSADAFLCELFDTHPDLVTATIAHQAAQLDNPPLSVDDVLDHLTVHAGHFADRVRAHRRRPGG